MFGGKNGDPLFTAELSDNHHQSLARAKAIVEAAAEAGADAIKLQTYTADTMTIDKADGEFFIDDPKSLWKGESLYHLYEKAYTPWEWQAELFTYAKQCGILCFSTPFDATAVDFLEKLDAPLYKIASFENIDLPLIRRVAKTGKPLIASTGMATVAELDDLVRTARENGCGDVTLLKCTSSYPARPRRGRTSAQSRASKNFSIAASASLTTRWASARPSRASRSARPSSRSTSPSPARPAASTARSPWSRKNSASS